MLELGINPVRPPFDPEAIIYFITDQFLIYHSVQSIKSWEAAIGWIDTLTGGTNTYWRQHPRYLHFRAAIQKQHQREAVQQLPINIEYLLTFAHKYNLHHDNLYQIPYDTLLKWTVILHFFFTISRPSEVLRRTQRGNDFGLDIGDIKPVELIRGDSATIQITVDRFKNCKFRTSVKTIFVHDPTCQQPDCKRCGYLNWPKCYRILLHRRHILAIKSTNKTAKRNLSIKIPTNAAYVMSNGSIMTAAKMNHAIKTMMMNIGIRRTTEYSNYSCRIGGTTHCKRIGLDHSKLLQYVGWKLDNLPDMAHRYTRYPSQAMQWIAHDMIHGTNANNRQRNAPSHTFSDPWREYHRWRTPPNK